MEITFKDLVTSKIVKTHLLDVITKIEDDWDNGYGVYDNFDIDDGYTDIRNTEALLVSLKTLYALLDKGVK